MGISIAFANNVFRIERAGWLRRERCGSLMQAVPIVLPFWEKRNARSVGCATTSHVTKPPIPGTFQPCNHIRVRITVAATMVRWNSHTRAGESESPCGYKNRVAGSECESE